MKGRARTSWSRVDRQRKTGAAFGRRALQFEKKWPIDQFDEDPAVLHGFDSIGDLDQLAGCRFRVGIGRSEMNFMPCP
jgi:hypothetical protein